MLPEVMPMKPPEVLAADFEAELVVYIPGTNRAHHLDEGLSLVLASCDGATLTGDLVAEVAAGTDQAAEDVERWLEASLESLTALGALTESTD